MMAPPAKAKRLLSVLGHRGTDRIPIWLMRQAGRYLPEYRALRERTRDFLTFCYTPELAIEATLQPIRRFGLDGAIIFSDILVVPDALGQKVGFVAGTGPVLEPLQPDGGAAVLSLDSLPRHLEPVYTAIRETRAALPAQTTLIGFAGAPWTLAAYMVEGGPSRDFAALKAWAYGAPDSFTALIDLLVEAVSCHLVAQIAAGAEVVQIFDTWAGILPEAPFRRWCLEPLRRITAAVKAAAPGVPVIAFPCRASMFYRTVAESAGIDALSIDAMVPPAWAAVNLQDRIAVQGNLDPMLLMVGGDPMKEAASAILQALGNGPFVFNLGHGVLPATPPDHVAALVDHVRAWHP